MQSSEDDSFPSELQERLTNFDDALSNFEDILKPLHSVPMSELHETMSALDKAKLDIIGSYAINSLFWIYLTTQGENPKEHGIKQELDRIRKYMQRAQEITDKLKAPKLNKDASKRFIRSALWQAAQREDEQRAAQQQPEDESTADDGEDKRAVITVDSDSDDVMPAKRSKRAGRRQK